MRSYAERETSLGKLLWWLNLAESLVEQIPHLDKEGREIRCHELARAVWHVLKPRMKGVGCVVVDGKFDHVDHSWLVLAGREILDVYAVGTLPQVQLHHGSPILADARSLYRPGADRSDIREDVVDAILFWIEHPRFSSEYVYREYR